MTDQLLDEDHHIRLAAAFSMQCRISKRDAFASIFGQFKQLENLFLPLDAQCLVQYVPVIEFVRTQPVL